MVDEGSHLEKKPEEIEIAPDAAEVRTDLSLDTLESKIAAGLTDDTTEQIAALDPKESLEAQVSELEALESVLEPMILRLMGKGASLEELSDDPGKIVALAPINSAEKQAQKKLEAILATTKDNEDFKELWVTICEFASDQFDKAKKLKKQIEDNTNPDSLSWMNSGMKVGLLVLGAYGGYRFLRWAKSKLSTQGKGESFPLISTSVGMFSIGSLLGPDKVKGWAEKTLGISISEDSIRDFVEKAKEGKLSEAFNALTLKGQYPGLSEASKKLDISKSHLIDLKDVKLKDFNKWALEIGAMGYKFGEVDLSDSKRKALSYSKWALSFIMPTDVNIPFLEIDDEMRAAEDELKLNAFIKKHKGRLGSDEAAKEMTIAEILAKFEREGLFE